MSYKTILNKLAQINSLIESIKYIQELSAFLAPIIIGVGGRLYMDYRTIGVILFVFGIYILIWTFRSSLKKLEKNLQIKLDKKIDIPEEIEFEQEFISLKDAIAIFAEGINNKYLDTHYTLCFNVRYRIKGKELPSNIEKLPKEIFMLFTFIADEMIDLYGYKLFATNMMTPSKILPSEMETLDFYNIDNWSEDFSIIYDSNKIAQYNNISIKSRDLYYKKRYSFLHGR